MKFSPFLMAIVVSTTIFTQSSFSQEVSLKEFNSTINTDLYKELESKTDSRIFEQLPRIIPAILKTERNLIADAYPTASSINLLIHVVNALAVDGDSELSSKDIQSILTILKQYKMIYLPTEVNDIINSVLAQLDKITISEVRVGLVRRQLKKAVTFYSKDGKNIEIADTKGSFAHDLGDLANMNLTLVLENRSRFIFSEIDEKESNGILQKMRSLESESSSSTINSIRDHWQGLKYHLQPGLAQNSASYFASKPKYALLVESENIYVRGNIASLIDRDRIRIAPNTINSRFHLEKILSLSGIKDNRSGEKLSPLLIVAKPTRILPEIWYSVIE